MRIHFSVLAPVCAALHIPLALAQPGEVQPPELGQVLVTATRIGVADTDATYASEVHGRDEIERSGATTLVDYLSRHTSVQVLPSYGSRFTPSISMRGYGLTDGHQNVVVTLDGRRLNNVDSVPQLLGAIALADVDRIEITKGSGSVMYGDGATAGSIQIHTRARTGVSVEGYAGSHDTSGGTVAAGWQGERLSVSATSDHSASGGTSRPDPTGRRDESRSDAWRMGLSARPVDALTIKVDAAHSQIGARYPGSLTRQQFERDPATNNGSAYTRQRLEADNWGVGAEFELSPAVRMSARHDEEDKVSIFGSGWRSDYSYRSDDLALQYVGEALAVTAGFQAFDGARKGSDSRTSKDNAAWFVQGQYRLDRLTVSAGARSERVSYRYRPIAGAALKDDERLGAWDIGANFRVSDTFTVFGNYNSAYQAPDIDRFFSYDWMTGTTNFNGFIEPARARTITLGLNHLTPSNRLKLSVFHARLKNEIYLEPFSYANTNIDRSHKYGVEVQDSWRISSAVTGLVNYAWTRAIIDREADGGGAYDGKELPGVPRHSVVLGLNVKVGDRGSFNLSHTWRSETWAADDFDNNNVQKQRAYQSTDLAYRHRVMRELELFAAVSNLFERDSGIWVGDDAIYPVDFERTWKLGARLSF